MHERRPKQLQKESYTQCEKRCEHTKKTHTTQTWRPQLTADTFLYKKRPTRRIDLYIWKETHKPDLRSTIESKPPRRWHISIETHEPDLRSTTESEPPRRWHISIETHKPDLRSTIESEPPRRWHISIETHKPDLRSTTESEPPRRWHISIETHEPDLRSTTESEPPRRWQISAITGMHLSKSASRYSNFSKSQLDTTLTIHNNRRADFWEFSDGDAFV